jgi:hypothetical protein
MREKLLAAAAVGALFTSPALAQSDQTTGAMSQADMQELEQTLEQAGLTDFRPVAGGEVFRGMSADGDAAVIAVAPETGNTAGEAGTSADASGSGMTDAAMFQVTTSDGRTLYVVVPPEMTGIAAGTSASTDTTSTQTAETTTEGDSSTADTTTTTTTTADTDTTGTSESTTGEATTADADTATTADTDSGATTGGDAAATGQALNMNIELSGAQQVPPVETSGTGQVAVTFNSETRELSWSLDYSDLSSDATAAHFHGPADPGETAPPVIPVDDFSDGAEGSATLTEEQAEQLMAGKMYFNLHTENNPNGEIRGQVTAVQ